jgi:hypothetical protein
MTVTVDGIFFDDGTFVGPDRNSFFANGQTQMDVRFETLMGFQKEIKSGKNTAAVFKELEQISEDTKGGNDPVRSKYRSLFAKDILGMKSTWGTEKAIETVEQQLGRPWVKLRKL